MTGDIFIVILAYLIGAVPTGYLIGKIGYGVDLKKTGSGNIGATNAYRTLGAKAGLLVFLADFLKGMIAVYLGMPEPMLVLACALFAIIGNDWCVFLKFKSGKGVACGVGAFTFICPPATLAAFIDVYKRQVAIGDENTANAAYAIAVGTKNTAAQTSTALGYNNNAKGLGSFGIGNTCLLYTSRCV